MSGTKISREVTAEKLKMQCCKEGGEKAGK